jgi:gluconokinase
VLIGIDLGTTSLKAGAYDPLSGRCLAEASARLQVQTDGTGRREQEPMSILASLESVLARLRKRTGRSRWASVSGLGLAAQGGSTLIAVRESGRPLTPMYLWNDLRCFPWFARIRDSRPPRFWRSFSLRNEPGMGLGRIAWLREREPHLFDSDGIYIGAGELVFHSLTGVWRQDAGHALQSGCYEVRTNRLAEEPADIVGLKSSFFAPIRPGHATVPLGHRAATRFELPEGVPVAGPYNDHEAGYLSVRHISHRPLQCSLGTAWVGNFVLEKGFKTGSGYQLPVPAPAGKGLLIIQPLLTGNLTWDWALEQFLDSNHKRALRLMDTVFSERLLPPAGLIGLPWLNRPNPLTPGGGAAAFFGMGPSTDGNELLRAMAAGMVFEFMRVFAHVLADGAVDSIVLCGGTSRSRVFQRLFTSLRGCLPVYVLEEADSMGTRGCLHAFGTAAAEVGALPCVAEPAGDGRELAALQQLYIELVERLYAGDAAGSPFMLD